MGAYSTNNSYGIEFGKLNGSRFGTYFSIKANSEMIDALNSYDEDITIATSDDLPENYSLGITSLSFGITKSLVYPVYLYLGGGVSYYNYYQVNDENYRTSYTLETQDEFIPFPEGGIALKLGKIAIKAGSQYVKEEFFSQVGLGIGL